MQRSDLAAFEQGLDAVLLAGLPSPFVRRYPRKPSRMVHICGQRADGGPFFRRGIASACQHCTELEPQP